MSDVYVSNADGERINPSTLEKEQEVVDRIDRLLDGPGSDASDYKTQKLTIDGAGLAQGVAGSYKLVWVTHSNSNATYMEINKSGDNADTGSFLLPADVVVGPFPIENAGHIHIYGTAADTVHLLLSK